MVTRPWRVHGPFELDKHSERSWKQQFREAVEWHPGLNDAIGVYVIAVTNQGRDRIKYVGMTHKQSFEAEVFSDRNRRDVWDVIKTQRCRALHLYLFAKPNVARRGYSFDDRLLRQAHLLEELLIMHAKAAGHVLINTKKMKSAEGIAVTGLFGVRVLGPRPQSAKLIAQALKLA